MKGNWLGVYIRHDNGLHQVWGSGIQNKCKYSRNILVTKLAGIGDSLVLGSKEDIFIILFTNIWLVHLGYTGGMEKT